jgi:hypothetical protein
MGPIVPGCIAVPPLLVTTAKRLPPSSVIRALRSVGIERCRNASSGVTPAACSSRMTRAHNQAGLARRPKARRAKGLIFIVPEQQP